MAFTPSNPGSGSGSSFPNPRFNKFQKDRQFGNQSRDEHRINERIRVPQVRLIDENGGQVGIVPTQEALRMARDRGLDLMEVSPNAQPPVCKICDYGKFKYEKKKKEQVAKKKQIVIKVKEVQLRPSTDDHDLGYKTKNIRTFIEDGDKAKITVMYRGREMANTESGYKMMRYLVEQTKDIAIVEYEPKMEGRKLIMILAPNSATAAAAAKRIKERVEAKAKEDAANGIVSSEDESEEDSE